MTTAEIFNLKNALDNCDSSLSNMRAKLFWAVILMILIAHSVHFFVGIFCAGFVIKRLIESLELEAKRSLLREKFDREEKLYVLAHRSIRIEGFSPEIVSQIKMYF